MKTIKIIDLLNKIANGEEVPKEIFYKKQWWKYNPDNDYEGTDWGGCFLNNVLISELNDEVEIIEETKKEIEQIGSWYEILSTESKQTQLQELNHNFNVIFDRLEQLINAVNESKNKEDK